MSDGYTLYDGSLPIIQEDAIVRHSRTIYPIVTSPEGEGSFPCWLCHEIEQDSPRSHFPPLTFVGDSGRLLPTHSQYAMAGVKFVPESWIYARSSTSNFFCELELGYHNVSSDGFVP